MKLVADSEKPIEELIIVGDGMINHLLKHLIIGSRLMIITLGSDSIG